MIRRAILFSLALVLLILLGLTVVPLAFTDGGAVVNSGSVFSFGSFDFLEIPVHVGHASTLVGSFSSNYPIDVYVLNYTEFWSFHDYNACPVQGVTPSATNSTHAAMNSPMQPGSYSLIFCIPFSYQYRNMLSVQVQITNSIRLNA
jgi:hypothetical protein